MCPHVPSVPMASELGYELGSPHLGEALGLLHCKDQAPSPLSLPFHTLVSPPDRDKDKDEGAVGALRAWQVGQVPREAMWTQ